MFFRILRLLLLVIILTPSLLIANYDSCVIFGLRSWPAPDSTRIVFDLDKNPKYKYFSLDNPSRFVIDFKNANISNKFKHETIADKRIRKIRQSKRDKNDYRFVIDLTENLQVEVFHLEPNEYYGHRLVVDLNTKEREKILELFRLSENELKSKEKQISDLNINLKNRNEIETKSELAINNKVGDKNQTKSKNNIDKEQKKSEIKKIEDVINVDLTKLQNNIDSDKTAKEKEQLKKPIEEIKKVQVTSLVNTKVLSDIKKVVEINPDKLEKYKEDKLRERNEAIQKRKFVIAIDPGHGGEDPGAIGKRGLKEKDVVLSISRELKKLIDKDKRMEAVLTRNSDYYVSLKERRERSRKKNVDLFISIHADAANHHSANGASVFVLSDKGSSSEHAKWLADRENGSDLVGGVSLEDKSDVLASVLLDLSQTACRGESYDAAKYVLSQMANIGPLHRNIVEKAGFLVLKAPDVPSILVETGFISNPSFERRLGSKNYQKRIARALYYGIKQYFSKKNLPNKIIAKDKSRLYLFNKGPKVKIYKVKKGDSLSKISKKMKISLKDLKRKNRLKSDRIEVGQLLKIPR